MQFLHVLLLVLPLAAQYNPYPQQLISLATNQDGSQLWFTSPLRQHGVDAPVGDLLYRWDGERVHLVAIPDRDLLERSIFEVETGPRPNQVAWQIYAPPPRASIFANQHRAAHHDGSGVRQMFGQIQFSEDGRFMMNYAMDAALPPFERSSVTVEDNDLKRSYTRKFAGNFNTFVPRGRWIANDGSYFVFSTIPGTPLFLHSPFREPIPFGPQPKFTWFQFDERLYLDPQTKAFAYERNKKSLRGEIVVRYRSLEEKVIATEGRLCGFTVGGEVLYIARNAAGRDAFQAYSIVDGKTRVIHEAYLPKGVVLEDAVLSRDESTYYLLLSNGSLHRMGRGPARTLRGYGMRVDAPFVNWTLDDSERRLAPLTMGFANFLWGRNLQGELRYGNGRRLAIRAESTGVFVFQLGMDGLDAQLCTECPQLELFNPAHNLVLPLETSSFRPPTQPFPLAVPLQWELGESRFLYLVHGDWRGVITREDPAQPNQTVHFYGSSLGRVAPLEGFLQLLSPLSCVLQTTHRAGVLDGPVIRSLFAGQVPQAQELFQVTLQLPPHILQYNQMTCANEAGEKFVMPLITQSKEVN